MSNGNTVTADDLLTLLGAKEAQIMLLQRQIAGLQKQIELLTEQLTAPRPEQDPDNVVPFKPKKGS